MVWQLSGPVDPCLCGKSRLSKVLTWLNLPGLQFGANTDMPKDESSLPHPSSIAVAGASGIAGILGDRVWRSLHAGPHQKTLLAVNFNFGELTGAVVYGRVQDLPIVPSLAIICSPPAKVAGLVDDFGNKGTTDVMVMTDGMDAEQRHAMEAAAGRHAMRMLDRSYFDIVVSSFGQVPAAAAQPLAEAQFAPQAQPMAEA